MKSLGPSPILALFILFASIFGATSGSANTTEFDSPEIHHRDADTCADPSLAITFIQGFSPSRTAHILQRAFVFVDANTNGDDWQLQRDAFRAWGSPQEFTVPLYALLNSKTLDYIYIMSTNGEVPVADGFAALGIAAYVYSTQVCGSVPLFTLFQDVAGDHWYTILESERDDFAAGGWIDSGIAAYVLPFSSW